MFLCLICSHVIFLDMKKAKKLKEAATASPNLQGVVALGAEHQNDPKGLELRHY